MDWKIDLKSSSSIRRGISVEVIIVGNNGIFSTINVNLMVKYVKTLCTNLKVCHFLQVIIPWLLLLISY